jgi:hypothetical protein
MLRSSDQVGQADNDDQRNSCQSEYFLSPHVARLAPLGESPDLVPLPKADLS